MFLSKIWFFLITIVAVVAITIALIMPKPAERAGRVHEDDSLRTACRVTNVILSGNARAQIQLASEFSQAARQLKLARTLFEASKGEIVSGQANATVRKELIKLVESATGPQPSFVWLLDRRGRVVARSNADDTGYGDSVRGYYAVQDALDGYVRDDLWMMEDGLYRVATAPVLTQSLEWAGAVVVGKAIHQEFALSLSESINANINFYVGEAAVAASKPIQIHKDVVDQASRLKQSEGGLDCGLGEILHATAGGERYAVVSASLPGEAGEQGAFYSVLIKRAAPLNFMGMLKSTKKADLGFGQFPWILVIVLLVGMMGVGLFLTYREVDTPLKKLNANAVALAQGETERFDESMHRSKFGSIARSVNIAIDKTHRKAHAAAKDLDQLLGPAPSDDVDAAASALPPIGPGGMSGAAAAPPPSEFKFGGPAAPHAPAIATPAPDAFTREKTPPPMPVAKQREATAPKNAWPTDNHHTPRGINADILGAREEMATIADDDQSASYFLQVYEEFIALKQKCGEPTENLTFERFSKKLQKNEDTLISKHACRMVRFQVYEKDGKAALKASPVK